MFTENGTARQAVFANPDDVLLSAIHDMQDRRSASTGRVAAAYPTDLAAAGSVNMAVARAEVAISFEYLKNEEDVGAALSQRQYMVNRMRTNCVATQRFHPRDGSLRKKMKAAQAGGGVKSIF